MGLVVVKSLVKVEINRIDIPPVLLEISVVGELAACRGVRKALKSENFSILGRPSQENKLPVHQKSFVFRLCRGMTFSKYNQYVVKETYLLNIISPLLIPTFMFM